jgi:hypothetical protein
LDPVRVELIDAKNVKKAKSNDLIRMVPGSESDILRDDVLKQLEDIYTAMKKASAPEEWRIHAYTYRTRVSDHIPSLTTYGVKADSVSPAASATASAKPS